MPSVLLSPHPACRAPRICERQLPSSGARTAPAPAPAQTGRGARLKSSGAALLCPLTFHSLGSRRTSQGWNSSSDASAKRVCCTGGWGRGRAPCRCCSCAAFTEGTPFPQGAPEAVSWKGGGCVPLDGSRLLCACISTVLVAMAGTAQGHNVCAIHLHLHLEIHITKGFPSFLVLIRTHKLDAHERLESVRCIPAARLVWFHLKGIQALPSPSSPKPLQDEIQSAASGGSWEISFQTEPCSKLTCWKGCSLAGLWGAGASLSNAPPPVH